MRSLAILIVTTALLSACASTSNTSSTNIASSNATLVEIDGLSLPEQIQAYEDQLIDNNHTKYATLSNLQVVRDYRTASYYAPNPYGIYAVDGKPVKKIPYRPFLGPKWYSHAANMAVAKVKIPPGKHVVELGQITAFNKSNFTLPEIDFQSNTDYISVFEGRKENRSISVYTYEQDDRFSRMDRDSIILKNKIASISIDK